MMESYAPSSSSSTATTLSKSFLADSSASPSLSTTKSKRPTMRTVAIRYVFVLMLALLAGSMNWKMQRHLESMSSTVQSALRLVAIDLLEHLEGYQLEYQAHKEEKDADALEHTAEKFELRGNSEEVFSERSRVRAEQLAKMAASEQEKADLIWKAEDHNENLRQQVLHNISLEQAEEDKMLQQMRTIHQGLCNVQVVSSICDAVGGITGLQQKADKEALLIQSQWSQVSALKRKEKLEEMVANMLQNKSAKLNNTANHLLHVAALWDERAQKEFELARLANQTATELDQDAQKKESLAKEEEGYETELDKEANQLLHQAQIDHTNAYWCAIVAIVAGFVALVFFVCQAAPRAARLIEQYTEWEATNGDSSISTSTSATRGLQWRNVSYCINHLLLFCAVVGMTGYYFINMAYYPVGQRFVIVVWFASLGSIFQTFLLHAVPRFLAEARAPVPDARSFMFHLGTKGLVIFFVFMLEVLFVWLSLGQLIFSSTPINVFNSLWFCFLTVVASLYHTYVFYETIIESGKSDSESVTVWRYGEHSTAALASQISSRSASASEVTPLCKEEMLSSGTPIDIHANNSNNTNSNNTSLQSPSVALPSQRFYQDIMVLRKELKRLLLPFEFLVSASMIALLRNCFRTVWNSKATALQCAVLICASLLILLGAVLVKDLTCDECIERSGRSRDGKKSRPDAVELIRV